MKYLNIVLWIVPILSLIMAVIALFFLPETIPVQIDFSGNYSNFGSKYILLIPPAVSIYIPISRTRPTGRNRHKNPWFLLLVELLILGAEIFAISLGLNYK